MCVECAQLLNKVGSMRGGGARKYFENPVYASGDRENVWEQPALISFV